MTSTFRHVFVRGTSNRTVLALHGTGGTEHDLLPIVRSIDPAASILGPRGQVLENGMPRFFRRLAEGVFDEEDLVRRTHELNDFLKEAEIEYAFDRTKLFAVGFSNGANIAATLLLLQPDSLGGAALFRPMVPLVPETLPDLDGKPILVAAGHLDPIVPPDNTRRLVELLRGCGANVTLRFENAGHGLTAQTIDTAARWFSGM